MEIINFVENSNALIIVMLLLVVMSVQFVFWAEKYNKLEEGIRETFIQQLRNKVEELLDEFVEALEGVPQKLQINEDDKKHFFIELGRTSENVKKVTSNGLLLYCKTKWVFEMYVAVARVCEDEYSSLNLETDFRPIVEFCERIEHLVKVQDTINGKLHFLESGDELLEAKFQQSKKFIEKFAYNPADFMIFLGKKEE